MAHAPSKDPNVFLLPDLGEGLAEAELIKWRVEVGQTVNELDVLAEMETDKALVEVTSPRGGTIAGLHGDPGEVIKVGTPLVTYGGGVATAPAKAADTPTPKSSAVNGTHSEPKPAPRVVEEPAERTADAGTVVGDMSGGLAGISAAPGKALATPAVRRLARDLNVDIDGVSGTGIGGRVLEKDVRAAAGGSKQSPAKSAPVHHAGENEVGRQAAALAPTRPAVAAGSAGGHAPAVVRREVPSIPTGQDTVRIPFRGVRRTIANRLRESVDRAVHFTVMDEADISALDVLRKKLAAASGEKLSVLPFVASAICRVLSRAEFRSLNATIEEKEGSDDAAIIQHRAVHLGIATDTDNGLMVPVIRDCDALGVLEIARHVAHVADAARQRTASREQLSGSTFTLSNVGSHAGRFATPIINYPECGILAAGRAREGLVVSKGSFRVGLLLPLSLACDHRMVDGATAALALAEIIKMLQEPDGLLAPARG